MKKKVSKAQVKTRAGIQIIIGEGRIGLLNIAKGQMLELTLEQAKLFGLEEEALLAERMQDETDKAS